MLGEFDHVLGAYFAVAVGLLQPGRDRGKPLGPLYPLSGESGLSQAATDLAVTEQQALLDRVLDTGLRSVGEPSSSLFPGRDRLVDLAPELGLVAVGDADSPLKLLHLGFHVSGRRLVSAEDRDVGQVPLEQLGGPLLE